MSAFISTFVCMVGGLVVLMLVMSAIGGGCG